MTDAVFWAESAGGVASLLRGVVAPIAVPVLPWVLRIPGLLSLGGRMLSQLWVRYPTGPSAVDERPAGRGLPRPGARLPDEIVTCGDERLPVHRLLERPGMRVLLQRDAADLRLPAPGPYVHLHRLTGREGGGVVVVRPDGHVGYRCGTVDDRLPAWLTRIGAVTAGRPLGEHAHG
ncbi:hypothetical protein [Actinoplanes solisilvae]|uniref:hypothetical protein n=1 Tax=Actinoplanes solisilvae TaxID=2486853 RepID=UPI000FD94C55|nr:hypothetical protein [Actinoplanes solisilvae]